MCYYRGLTITNHDVLKIGNDEHEISKYGINELVIDGFAYGTTPVIVAKNGGWEMEEMEWGFLPPYLANREAVHKFRRGYMDENGKFKPAMTTLNAVGEEMLLPGKMYRDAALNRRCLFITTCFYEWRHIFPIGKKGKPLKTAVKYPYCIRAKGINKISLIAGIWQPWTDKETGETVKTCSLVTTKANPLMLQIHNTKKRMPTILTNQLAAEWISKDISEERISELATLQFPADHMEAWAIQKDFKTALNPLEPFSYEELPALHQ